MARAVRRAPAKKKPVRKKPVARKKRIRKKKPAAVPLSLSERKTLALAHLRETDVYEYDEHETAEALDAAKTRKLITAEISKLRRAYELLKGC